MAQKAFLFLLCRVPGDGNCLYGTASLAISGDLKLVSILRALTSAELYVNAKYYGKHPDLESLIASKSMSRASLSLKALSLEAGDCFEKASQNFAECIEKEAFLNCKNQRLSSLVCMMGLSSI